MKTRIRNRLIFAGVAFLLFALLASAFQTAFWSRDYARARALHVATEFCQRSGRDPALLTDPREGTVGNRPWSFEWHYDGQPRYLIGVWFSHNGHSELYTGPTDDPASAAYEPR